MEREQSIQIRSLLSAAAFTVNFGKSHAWVNIYVSITLAAMDVQEICKWY